MTSIPKRILFLVPAFAGGVGGAERVIATLLRHVDHSRFECHLGLVQAGNAFLDGIPKEVAIHRLQVSRMRYCLPGIVRLVRQIRPQTILSTVSYLNVMTILARPFLPRSTRVILREATTPSAFIAKDTEHPALWKFLYRHVYRRADKIVCLSDAMKRDLIEHFSIPPDLLVRIYNPLDIEMIQRSASEAQNPFGHNGPNLVGIGRLRKEKGFDLLISAMALVAQKLPDARLTILGEGPDEAKLKALGENLGLAKKINFAGFVHNPWPYIKHADLFVLPSRAEGLPNSLLEALALGTPVVASDCVDSMHELQAMDPRIVLFPSENPAAMADAIVAVLSKQKDAGSPSLPRYEEFDPHRVVEDYSRLF